MMEQGKLNFDEEVQRQIDSFSDDDNIIEEIEEHAKEERKKENEIKEAEGEKKKEKEEELRKFLNETQKETERKREQNPFSPKGMFHPPKHSKTTHNLKQNKSLHIVTTQQIPQINP